MKLRSEDALIVIFSGKARSGKDTAMNIIREKYEKDNKKVINLQFSSYIKEYAKRISNWDGTDETKPRELLQELGTDIIRNKIDKYFFINRIIDDIKVYSYFFDIIMISDARFPEEIDAVKKQFKNTISIHINRPNNDTLTDRQKVHITETALDNYSNYDYIVNNDGTIEDLECKLDSLYKSL